MHCIMYLKNGLRCTSLGGDGVGGGLVLLINEVPFAGYLHQLVNQLYTCNSVAESVRAYLAGVKWFTDVGITCNDYLDINS